MARPLALRKTENGSFEMSGQLRRLLRLICIWPKTVAGQKSQATRGALAAAMGVAGEATIRYMTSQLMSFGLIEERNVAHVRVYLATDAGRQVLDQHGGVADLQLVGGEELEPIIEHEHIHAGDCGVQYETTARMTTLREILGLKGDEYKVTVRGDCMSGGQRPIFEGDIILLAPRSRICKPRNGSVAHVELAIGETGENEILLRQYYYNEETRQVTLRCTKPGLSDETYDDDEVDPRGEVIWHIGAANPNK